MAGFQSVAFCQRLKVVPTGNFLHLPTMNIAKLLCRCDVTVHSSCLGSTGVGRITGFVSRRRIADIFLILHRSGTGHIRHVIANQIKQASLGRRLDFNGREYRRNAEISRMKCWESEGRNEPIMFVAGEKTMLNNVCRRKAQNAVG